MPNVEDSGVPTMSDDAPTMPDLPVIAAGYAEHAVVEAVREARDALARLEAIAHAAARALDATPQRTR